jgi:3-hydroxybutyrate dehydrogenase
LPYNASKHALSGLTKTVAKEYASYGITCNEICPGPIESELMERIARDRERESGISREDYRLSGNVS